MIDKLKLKKIAILKGQFRQIRDWWTDKRINSDTYFNLCYNLEMNCKKEGIDIDKIYKEV